MQPVAPGDGAEEQQDEGKDPDLSAHPRLGAMASVSPGALVQRVFLLRELPMDSCILHYFVMHRTTVCVAYVKQQSLCIFQIKEKTSPVYYSVPQTSVLGTGQKQGR